MHLPPFPPGQLPFPPPPSSDHPHRHGLVQVDHPPFVHPYPPPRPQKPLMHPLHQKNGESKPDSPGGRGRGGRGLGGGGQLGWPGPMAGPRWPLHPSTPPKNPSQPPPPPPPPPWIPNRHGLVDTPHVFCPVEDGSNPRGDRDTPNDPNPPFLGERERERERERVGRSGKGTERSNREERERVGRRRGSRREWEGESGRETHRARVGG